MFTGILGRLDDIERFAGALIILGISVVGLEAVGAPLAIPSDALATAATDWAPGLVLDGLLLWVVNGIIRRHERTRVLSQMGSMSREFALDATRRARDEGWLTDGSLSANPLSRASLRGADLSGGVLAGSDLTFADLRESTLAYADLRGADLTGADLRETDLRWADLSGAVLQWADLRGAMLDGTRLEGVDARYAAVDPRRADDPALAGSIAGGFLDDDQVGEIRRTFDLFTALGPAGGERFYQRLFERAPEVRALFRSDPAVQARKFLQMLNVIVSALHTPTRHVAVLQSLGERHRGYGVAGQHYDLVGETLIAVMADALGPDLTPAARSAWERAFDLMTVIMHGPAHSGAEPFPPPVMA